MKKGFTIVELLMVIGIIGVLLGIVTTAAAGSIRQARAHKADACCRVVEQGLANNKAQKGRWPGSIGSQIAGGNLSARSNSSGASNSSNDDLYVLDESEVDDMVTALVRESVSGGNPMLDISGLYVSRSTSAKSRGMDFMDAIHGTKRSPKKMTLSEMHFGYPEAGSGYFRSFKIVYSIPSDEMKVSKQ